MQTFLRIYVIQMVVAELHTGLPIGRVELVGNVPAERTELPAFLHHRVHEWDAVEHRLPLWQVAHIEEILRDAWSNNTTSTYDES